MILSQKDINVSFTKPQNILSSLLLSQVFLKSGIIRKGYEKRHNLNTHWILDTHRKKHLLSMKHPLFWYPVPESPLFIDRIFTPLVFFFFWFSSNVMVFESIVHAHLSYLPKKNLPMLHHGRWKKKYVYFSFIVERNGFLSKKYNGPK